jgi:CBS domain-containing protein
MRVSEAMSRHVRVANVDETIQDAAQIMAEIDAGVVPVSDDDRLVGMLTDRDIVVRAIAQGKGPDTKVGDVMTKEVKYCFEDEKLDQVIKNMGELRVRRLPVLNRDKRLVGILSLGDIASQDEDEKAGQALQDISRPGGPHSQSSQTTQSRH